jgi:hypothetical protein
MTTWEFIGAQPNPSTWRGTEFTTMPWKSMVLRWISLYRIINDMQIIALLISSREILTTSPGHPTRRTGQGQSR